MPSNAVNLAGFSTNISSNNLLVGGGTSTGTASQPLQVTGGAYVSGNLGVGATNPDQILHLRSPGTNVYTRYTNDTINAYVGINTNNSSLDLYTGSNHSIRFVIGNATKGFLDINGNLILNTTNTATGTASQPLQVTGGAYVSGNLGVGVTNPGAKLVVDGDVRLAGLDAEIEFNTGGARLKGRTNALSIHTGGGLDTETSERVRINTTGVGIGTTNPQALLQVGAATTQSVFVDTSGRLLVGIQTARANFFSSTYNAKGQIEGTGTGLSSPERGSLAIINNSSGDDAPLLILAKTRGTTIGSNTACANGEWTGHIGFNANDGTKFVELANIVTQVDGSVGVSSVPGRLVFSTTAAGSNSPTERMRIRQDGSIEMGKADSGDKLAVLNASASNGVISAYATSGTYASTAMYVNASRANNIAYNFIRLFSGDFADVEFNLRGDGNAFADGTWTGGGADYAEYFEWVDGNTAEEDRRGISVVLDGDKIREATTGEEPIGVISGNPSVVGDGAWNKWSGKYLRDEFGTYIQEDYEVEDEDGNTVVQQRRKLNPAYNPDQEYIPREQRPEWDCVGLMGKLRIRKGQVTGARWIKMRDVSANVEEWLVR